MPNCQLLYGLNEAQQTAVLHGEGPALVAAGPGSGKTTCLTRRILYLIQERQIPPQEILVLTFTKEAAKTMQSKFLSLLSQSAMNRNGHNGDVHFATLHSFSYQMLQNISKYSEFQIITGQEKKRIAKEVYTTFHVEEITEMEVNSFINRISFAKNTGMFRKSDATLGKEEQLEEENNFRKMFHTYEEKMRKYHRMDFDDMVYLCKKELEESVEWLTKYQERYKYILVDEFQDLNTIQYQLLYLLCRKHKNIYVVGDDDQAIYGFRGSFAGIFQSFMNDFTDTKLICLGKNYRCAPNIVMASKELIKHNELRVVKDLEADEMNEQAGRISCLPSQDFKECVAKIIMELKELSESQLQEQAILFRTNFPMQAMANALTAYHIPYVLREKQNNLYEHFIVHDIMDYFEAAYGNQSREIYIRIFQKLSPALGREALMDKKVNLQNVKTFYQNGFYESKAACEKIEGLERNLCLLRSMRPALGIKFILNAMEYKRYLLRKAKNQEGIWNEWQQILEWMSADAEACSDYHAWKKHRTECSEELEKRIKQKRENQKGIHLLTLHAAKGLEFKKVFIVNVNEGNIPGFSRGEILTRERLEEERRLFYVGITRAKEVLELHYLTGTKDRPKYKSRFLEELKLPQKAT